MSDRFKRKAAFTAAALALGALELLWRALAPDPDPRVVRADFGTSAIIIGIIGLVGSLFGSQRGKVDGFVARALDGMKEGIADLADKVIEGALIVAWQFARVWDWLKKHIARIARALYDVIATIVKRLARMLDKVLGPIIDFLEKARDRIWQIYRDYVRPVLDVIEFIRAPLRILSAFGVDWAKRLDATLGNLEDWITENFTEVMGRVNRAIDVLNGIVDVGGLLKRIALTKSLFRDINIWVGLAWWKMHRPADQATLDDYRRALPTASQDARARQLHEYMRTRGGELAPVIDEALDDAFLIARRVRSGL